MAAVREERKVRSGWKQEGYVREQPVGGKPVTN